MRQIDNPVCERRGSGGPSSSRGGVAEARVHFLATREVVAGSENTHAIQVDLIFENHEGAYCLSIRKFISDTINRQDVFWLARFNLNLVSNILYVSIDGAFI